MLSNANSINCDLFFISFKIRPIEVRGQPIIKEALKHCKFRIYKFIFKVKNQMDPARNDFF